jgi:hypothetical protein
LKKLDPKLEKKIIEFLKDHSQGETSRHFKVGSGTVNRIAKAHNIPPAIGTVSEHSNTKSATLARKAYCKEDRLIVLNKLMERVDMAIDDPALKINQLCFLTTALGTLLDKYRLEEKDMDNSSKGEALDLLNRMKGEDARAA